MATGSFLYTIYTSMACHTTVCDCLKSLRVCQIVRGESSSRGSAFDSGHTGGGGTHGPLLRTLNQKLIHQQSVTMHLDVMNLQTFDSKRSGSRRMLNFLDGDAEVDSWIKVNWDEGVLSPQAVQLLRNLFLMCEDLRFLAFMLC